MTKQSLRLLIALFLVLTVRVPAGQPHSGLKKLPAAESVLFEQKIDRGLLPQGSGKLEFQRDQAVSLSNASSMKLLPVRFESPSPGGGTGPHFECGLFMTTEGHALKFLPTFGTDRTEPESCNRLSAIGSVDIGQAEYPGILLIYQAYVSPDSFPQPVLLRWDSKMASYRVDAEQSEWLGQQKEGDTIPGARRLLIGHVRERPAS